MHFSVTLGISLPTQTPLPIKPAHEEVGSHYAVAGHEGGKWVISECAPYRSRRALAQF